MRNSLLLVVVCLAVEVWAGEYLSPESMALSVDGKTLYIAAATADKILRVDLERTTLSGEILLKDRSTDGGGFWGRLFGGKRDSVAVAPSGLAVANDGTLLVTGGGANGFLQRLTPDGRVVAQVAVGHSPRAPLMSADGKKIYLLNRFNNCVKVLDAGNLHPLAEIAVLREPFASALGAGGKLLFVANMLPYCRATNAVVAASVSIIDTTADTLLRHVMLPNGSTGVRGVCASPDGAFVYITHTLGRYQLPTTQLERGWMNTAALSIFNGANGDYVNTILLDDVDLGAANPWGVAVSADGKDLVVAHAGTREISLIDRRALHERIEQAAQGKRVTEVTYTGSDVVNDLSFLVSLRRRVKLESDGPRNVTIIGGKAYVSLYFADTVAVVDLASTRVATLALGAPVDLSIDRVRRGEVLWNDATMCFQHWHSCASCHLDNCVDALNWDLLNDGIGNPKQTKNMIYVHLTPPTMVTGIRPDLQACNRKGLIHIQFVVRPEEDALCLDAFTMALRPVASPWLVNGRLSAKARKGEKVFKQAGCAHCHSTERVEPADIALYTNLQKYNLGLGIGNEINREFDTPTLLEVWRSGPYLYDGRALTIEEVLTTCNPENKHGNTGNLSSEELEVLAEYVKSL